ncbi:hypothetical protein BHU09_08480 [Tannerella sp. oral taxon 808]|nr:hypothetical protein BHU09_08480 [Tannerella sp. oral taxon 808]
MIPIMRHIQNKADPPHSKTAPGIGADYDVFTHITTYMNTRNRPIIESYFLISPISQDSHRLSCPQLFTYII